MPIDKNEYEELEKYNFTEEYLEMIEYSIYVYDEGLILADLTIPDMKTVKMEMVDLDAVRWHRGEITAEELYQAYRKYYLRSE